MKVAFDLLLLHVLAQRAVDAAVIRLADVARMRLDHHNVDVRLFQCLQRCDAGTRGVAVEPEDGGRVGLHAQFEPPLGDMRDQDLDAPVAEDGLGDLLM